MFKKIIFIATILLCYATLCVTGCKKADPTCENWGVPVDGTCSCQVGYSGPNCVDEQTPQYFEVTSVSVVSYPTDLGNGVPYDVGNAPDPILFVGEEGKTTPIFTGAVKANLPVTEAATWVGSFKLKPNVRYKFEMSDYDSPTQYDPMGQATADLWEETKGKKFPSKITLVNRTFKVELTLLYRF